MGRLASTVPGAIAVISFLFTLWLSAGITNSPFIWFPFIQAGRDEFTRLIMGSFWVGIAGLVIWYFCHSITTFFALSPKNRIWLYDYTLLAVAFGIIPKSLDQIERKKAIEEQLRTLQESEKMGKMCIEQKNRILKEAFIYMLLAELHVRLHSHAPQSVIDHLNGRNILWYMALNSLTASMLGWIFAVLVIWVNLFHLKVMMWSIWGYIISYVIFVVIFPCILHTIAKRFSKEGWDVYCKWIAWDIQAHPAPSDWWRNDIHPGRLKWYERLRHRATKC